MMDRYQQIVLASRPTGAPVAENFCLESDSMPVPSDGEILVRARYLSLDPYMRGRMNAAKPYAKPALYEIVRASLSLNCSGRKVLR